MVVWLRPPLVSPKPSLARGGLVEHGSAGDGDPAAGPRWASASDVLSAIAGLRSPCELREGPAAPPEGAGQARLPGGQAAAPSSREFLRELRSLMREEMLAVTKEAAAPPSREFLRELRSLMREEMLAVTKEAAQQEQEAVRRLLADGLSRIEAAAGQWGKPIDGGAGTGTSGDSPVAPEPFPQTVEVVQSVEGLEARDSSERPAALEAEETGEGKVRFSSDETVLQTLPSTCPSPPGVYQAKLKNIEIQEDDAKHANVFGGWGCAHFNTKTNGTGGVELQDNFFLRIVTQAWFDAMAGAVVVLNVAFVGIKTEVLLGAATAIPSRSSGSLDWIVTIELTFTVALLVEWLIRLLAYRQNFFRVKDAKWHAFDTMLIVSAVVESLADLLAGNSYGEGSSVSLLLRITRFIRAVRLVRVIKVVGGFRTLRLMVYGMLSSAQSLFWSIVFLAIVVYFFTILFLQAVLTYLGEAEENRSTDLGTALIKWYGSVFSAMGTLFMAISGGTDWEAVMDPLRQISGVYYILFVLYISIVVYGVLNVMTGIFVESAMITAKLDRDVIISDEQRHRSDYITEMTELFQEIDTDRSGYISWEELQSHLKDERVITYFRTLGLNVTEAKGLFRLLDVDNSHKVALLEFVNGCFTLKSEARALDLATLKFENKKMMEAWTRFMAYAEDQFQTLDGTVRRIAGSLNVPPVKSQDPKRPSKMASKLIKDHLQDDLRPSP